MNTIIISGSNRAESGSRKVSDYITSCLQKQGASTSLWDMHEMNLPLWTDDMWNQESEQSQMWQQYSRQLQDADSLVIVAAEWNGTIPPSLQNILTYVGRHEVGHKPTLIVSVSAGIGGTYPISQIKGYANKNNRMLFIPDHVIVRNVADDFDGGERPIGPRIKESLKELSVYAKHITNVRDDLEFDYKQFNNGM